MRQLPAQPARAKLAHTPERRRGGRTHPLAVQLRALAKPDEQPALAGGVDQREVAVLGLRLAGLDEPVERAVVDVVVDLLVLDHADRDGVGIGILRQVGGGFDDHGTESIRRGGAGTRSARS